MGRNARYCKKKGKKVDFTIECIGCDFVNLNQPFNRCSYDDKEDSRMETKDAQ